MQIYTFTITYYIIIYYYSVEHDALLCLDGADLVNWGLGQI